LGRTRETGLDCFGLVIRVAWDLGLSQFTFDGYDRMPNPQHVIQHCDAQMTRIPAPEAQVGDVILMAFGTWPSHLAILADKARPFSLIHAYAGMRQVCETSLSGDLLKGVKAWYRLPNVEAL
jgi:cell wall-associated NlpC family hydrolase